MEFEVCVLYILLFTPAFWTGLVERLIGIAYHINVLLGLPGFRNVL